MTATFHPISHPLFDALKIPCGIIEVSGQLYSGLIYDLVFGWWCIQERLSTGLITTEDVETLKGQMSDMNIMTTESDMFAKIALWDGPPDFMPAFMFELHHCQHPMVHGHMRMFDNSGSSKFPFFTLVDGLNGVMEAVHTGFMTANDGAHLLQQMVFADLSHNSITLAQKIEALPPDVRKAHKLLETQPSTELH